MLYTFFPLISVPNPLSGYLKPAALLSVSFPDTQFPCLCSPLHRENPHCSRRKKENIRQQPIYQSIANHNLKACTNKTHAVLYDTEIIPKKLFRAVSISKNTLQNDRKRGKQCV